jgi:hypothetical protein
VRLAAQCRHDAASSVSRRYRPAKTTGRWCSTRWPRCAWFRSGVRGAAWRCPPIVQRKPYWIEGRVDAEHENRTQAVGQRLKNGAVLAVLHRGAAPGAESEINIHLPFLEMGADSLVMVEAIGIIEFGVSWRSAASSKTSRQSMHGRLPRDGGATRGRGERAGVNGASDRRRAHVPPSPVAGRRRSTLLVEQTPHDQFMAQQTGSAPCAPGRQRLRPRYAAPPA